MLQHGVHGKPDHEPDRFPDGQPDGPSNLRDTDKHADRLRGRDVRRTILHRSHRQPAAVLRKLQGSERECVLHRVVLGLLQPHVRSIRILHAVRVAKRAADVSPDGYSDGHTDRHSDRRPDHQPDRHPNHLGAHRGTNDGAHWVCCR